MDEPTPTVTGWKLHGELVVGDRIFGPDGKSCTVIALNRVVHDAECYEIEFDDGSVIQAGSEHLWSVERRTRKRIPGAYNRPGPKRQYRETVLLQTRELAAHRHTEDNRLAIRVNDPLDLPDIDLPVEPYVLGVWLGDGTSANGAITCGDAEVFEHIQRAGYQVGNDRTPERNAALRTIASLSVQLRQLGVRGQKRIPDAYLRSSATQRLSLLQGLMDTDGHCNTRGTATFVNTNADLVEGFCELANSLGLKPRKRLHAGAYDGKPYPYWQVSFQAYAAMPPFRLDRKMERCKPGPRPNPRRYVVSCRKVASVPMRCIQVDRPDGLYLTGRSMITTHNSTIITFGLTIQEILASHGDEPLLDEELTFGIFSHTRPIGKAFLRQIKVEFEINERLKLWFPDVLWADPRKQALKWSEDEGIVVQRKSNPKEATVEAWGLVDGQPTSKHYRRMVYDDTVTRESVTTPEMIKKTTEAWELSRNLAAEGGESRYIGTRYHFLDTYKTMMERGIKARIYPATLDGTASGDPVLMSRETLARKRVEMGATFNSQMLQNPSPNEDAYFRKEWFRWYDTAPKHLAKYGASDFAVTAKGGDFTVHIMAGVDPDDNLYILDIWRKQTTTDKWIDQMIGMMQEHQPYLWGVPADQIKRSVGPFLIKSMADRKAYIALQEMPETGDKPAKARSFQGRMATGKVYFPKQAEWLDDLVMEMAMFPVGHDDQIDALGLLGRMLNDMTVGTIPTPNEANNLADYGDNHDDAEPDGWRTA